jgi:hypothetical protein
MTTLSANASRSQQFQTQSNPSSSPLESLIADLRVLRDGMIGTDRRRRAAILVGQLALLAREYQSGRRPSRRTLKRFFYFVAREQAI